MKILKLCLFAIALVLSPLAAFGSTYIGDFCWAEERPDGSARYFKLGIFNAGGGHYSVKGRWANDDASQKMLVSGTAGQIDGEWEILVYRGSSGLDFGGWGDFRVYHFDLESDFNGTITTTLLGSPSDRIGYRVFPVTLTDCADFPE